MGGLARKGVLRVHHDDVKAAEEQTNRPDPFEEVIEDEDVLRLREERAQKREQREARKRELQAEAKAALERANSKPVRKSGYAKRPAKIKQYKRKPLSNKRNTNQDVSAKLRKILGSAEGQKAYKRLREADAFFQQEQFFRSKEKTYTFNKKGPESLRDTRVIWSYMLPPQRLRKSRFFSRTVSFPSAINRTPPYINGLLSK